MGIISQHGCTNKPGVVTKLCGFDNYLLAAGCGSVFLKTLSDGSEVDGTSGCNSASDDDYFGIEQFERRADTAGEIVGSGGDCLFRPDITLLGAVEDEFDAPRFRCLAGRNIR